MVVTNFALYMRAESPEAVNVRGEGGYDDGCDDDANGFDG